MGALHAGHLSLIRIAKQHCDEVVVSIYVNPEQFGPNEDFGSYPRTLEADLKACEKEGVSVVFTPSDEMMYGSGKKYLHINIDEMNVHMDGGSRPGFFEGILLVVNKLFNIITPDVAVFGQKDIQQFLILSRMVKEFNHDVEMIMAPIMRAPDGLALSSRNAYLSTKERETAPFLFKTLNRIRTEISLGSEDIESIFNRHKQALAEKGFKNDYLNVYSKERLAPVSKLKPNNTYIIAGAVYLGKTRLIDNIIFEI